MLELLARLQARLRMARGGDGGASRSYWKSVGTLTGGTVAAQAIGIVSMLALARIYAPAEFGAYALFFAYSGLLALIGTAKYDAAVFMAKRHREAIDLAMLGVVFSLLSAALVVALTPLLGFLVVSVTEHPSRFMLLLAAATATGGTMAALTAWAMQIKAFAVVTLGRMAQAIVTAAISIGLGIAQWDATGLILGFLAGQLAFCIVVAWRLAFFSQARRFTWRAARTRARRSARFPRYLLVSEVLNYVGGNVVSLITPSLFGAAALGQYNMGQRLAMMPANLVGTAMGGIFRTAISPQHANHAEVPALFRAALVRLSLVGALFSLPLLLAGPALFAFALGPQWHDAGVYVQILAPLVFARFVVSPLSAMLFLRNRQRLDMMLQMLFVVTAFAAVGIGMLSGSFLQFVFALSAMQVLIYCVYLAVSWQLAREMKTR